MTSRRRGSDEEIVAMGGTHGWRLAEHPLDDTAMWRWLRHNDELMPSFPDRESAITWMRELLSLRGR